MKILFICIYEGLIFRNSAAGSEQEKNRIMLEGDVPNPVNIPQGCAFHTRCRYATQRCRTMRPILSDVKDGHQVSCHLYSKEASGNKEENPAPAEV